MLDQELLAKSGLGSGGGRDQQGTHLTHAYSQFQHYQQSMAAYNNMGYGFPAGMYGQNGYSYQLSPYPHTASPPVDGKYTFRRRAGNR